MTSQRKLLTIPQAAEELSMSPKTLWAWKAARKVAVVMLGRSVRIPQTEIDRILIEGTIPARQTR